MYAIRSYYERSQYNIFNIMNTKTVASEKQIADLLKVLGSSFRVKLLYGIGYGEARNNFV